MTKAMYQATIPVTTVKKFSIDIERAFHSYQTEETADFSISLDPPQDGQNPDWDRCYSISYKLSDGSGSGTGKIYLEQISMSKIKVTFMEQVYSTKSQKSPMSFSPRMAKWIAKISGIEPEIIWEWTNAPELLKIRNKPS